MGGLSQGVMRPVALFKGHTGFSAEHRLQESQGPGGEKDEEVVTVVHAGVTGRPEEQWRQRERNVHGLHQMLKVDSWELLT